MWYKQHLIINTIPAFMWGYLTSNWLYAILFYIAGVLIDFDHFLAVGFVEKRWNPFELMKSLETEYNSYKKKYEERLACVFHTVEFMILLGILGYYYSFFVPILFGVMFHVVCDIATVAWKKNKRIFFTSFYILKYFKLVK